MREQIEQLIAELKTKAQQHEKSAEGMGSGEGIEIIREYAKAAATYHCIGRLWQLLADSQPVSGEIDTRDRV